MSAPVPSSVAEPSPGTAAQSASPAPTGAAARTAAARTVAVARAGAAARTSDRAAPLDPLQLVEYTRFLAEEIRANRYPYVEFDPDVRWHRRLYRDPRVDVWLIGWSTSQGTELHDHGGSAGAFTVVSGRLDEARYIASGRQAGTLVSRRLAAGRSVGFDHRYVHDVRNLEADNAVSVHAYSPPLTAMSYYEVEPAGLRRIATTLTEDPEPDRA